MITRTNAWIPLGIVAALSSAMSIICDKMGAHYIEGAVVGIFEASITLVMLVGVFTYSKNSASRTKIDRNVLPYIMASAFCTAFSWVLYYVIMNHASVCKAASIDQFSLIFVFVMAISFLGDAINWKSLVGAVLLLVGMALMIL